MMNEYFENMDRFTHRSMPSEIDPVKNEVSFVELDREADQLGLRELFDFNVSEQFSEITLGNILQVFSRLGERNSELALYLSPNFTNHVYKNLLELSLDSADTISPFRDCSAVFQSGRKILFLQLENEKLLRSKVSFVKFETKFSGFTNLDFITHANLIKSDGLPIVREKYEIALAIHSLVLQAIYLGLVGSSIRYAHKYACSRLAFGKPIIHFQAVSQKIANMCIHFEIMKTHLTKVVPENLLDPNIIRHAVQGEMLSSEFGPSTLQECIQCLGGHGYVNDHPLEKMFRNGLTLLGFIQQFSKILKVSR